MDVLNTLWEARDVVLELATLVVIVASLIVAGTRTPDPGTFLGKAYRVIEYLALTFGKAKDPGVKKAS